MAEERLLKRLRRWSSGAAGGTDVGSYVESVLQDVGKLYNTRRGSTPPDVENIRAAIEVTTREFEPRMQDTKVSLPGEDSPGMLRFAVQADLLYEKTRIALRYQVNIEGDGRVTVRQ